MTITETRNEMNACVEALRARLAGVTDPQARLRLGEKAKREIERIRKAFKRRLDQRALRSVYHHPWFAIHEREGLEQALEQVTAAALRAIDDAIGNVRAA